jgi:hypothetical protein
MKDTIVSQCLDILKREDIKYEFRNLLSPVINLILYEVYPYIYLIISFVFLIFTMILAILILLLRNK